MKRKSAIKPGKKLIKNPKIAIYSAIAVILASFIGTRFTDVSGWYESIKPAITPPNFVFGIVWTILFILIAISMYLSISNANKKQRNLLVNLFAINLILNVLWSGLFFGAHAPIWAFADLVLLWASIMLLIKFSWKTSKLAAWLLLPYALWVIFAGLLNYIIAFIY